jgi:aryl-alcohol dehydrogenase-like predicted oxidoreductase
MSDLNEMSRVLYDHQWERAADWASKLDQLADLTDEEIGRLVGISTARPERIRA